MKLLVGLAGPIGSGKTSIARELARELGGTSVSFGDAVRAEARRRNMPSDREGLQDLGEQMIAEGWPAFIEQVLATTGDDVDVAVVDGIRHREAIDALRSAQTTCRFVLVYVHTDAALRHERLKGRDGMSTAEFETASTHENERQVESLRELANFTVDNSDSQPQPTVNALAVQILRQPT